MSAEVFEAALHDVREYFSLHEAAERSKTLEPAARTTLARAVRLSAQRRAAAEALARAGQTAEAVRAMRDAHALLAAHAELVGLAVTRTADSARTEAAALDDELSDEHAELFEQLRDEQMRLQVRLGAIGLEPRKRLQRATNRRAGAAGLALGLTIALVFWLGKTRLVADASGSWSEKYPASNAVDGDESTHWVMPDKSLGWLDVKLLPPRKLATVSVLPGYAPPTYSVVDYRLEAYAGGNVVAATDGTFVPPPGGGKPPWTAVALPTDVKVDKVRLVVKSYHDIGGSIAEVKVP